MTVRVRESKKMLVYSRLRVGLPGLLILCLLLSCGSDEPSGFKPLPEGIQDAAEYLLKNVESDGSFIYRVNMDPDVEVAERYNMVRHAGTIYSLCAYYDWSGDADVLPVVRRTSQFLLDNGVGPIAEREDCLGVWSKLDITGREEPLQVKLGAVGLGLVALVGAEKLTPDVVTLAELQKLGNMIRYMQKPDGSFCCKYIPSEGGLRDDWQSLFYPGEAARGLLMLYERDPSPTWLEAAESALAYLALSRRGQGKAPPDHWALLATEKLLQITEPEQLQHPERLFIDHAAQICNGICRSQIIASTHGLRVGGFAPDGRVTPTSTRLEGLLAALNILPSDHPMREKVEYSVHLGMAFLRLAQVAEGRFQGAFPRAIELPPEALPPDHQQGPRVTEVRIDYVQHSLSAMIQYQRLFPAESEESTKDQ